MLRSYSLDGLGMENMAVKPAAISFGPRSFALAPSIRVPPALIASTTALAQYFVDALPALRRSELIVVAGFQVTVAIGLGDDAVALPANGMAAGVGAADEEAGVTALTLTSTSIGLTSMGLASAVLTVGAVALDSTGVGLDVATLGLSLAACAMDLDAEESNPGTVPASRDSGAAMPDISLLS